jgi:hypothetical protein
MIEWLWIRDILDLSWKFGGCEDSRRDLLNMNWRIG